MKQSKLFIVLFPFIVMAIPWIYLAIIWNDLPAIIPTHFGWGGKPDDFASKPHIIFAPAVMSVVAIGMYFLLRNIYKIDPKRKYTATTSGVLAKVAVVMVILLCGVCLFILYWTLHGKIEGLNILFCGLSLFLAYVGNIMHSVKPNYFAGFRLPWALENEDNWRKTHHLASKVWFISGVILAIIALIVSVKIFIFAFFAGILVMTLVPTIYSYKLYKRALRESTNQNTF